MIKYSQAKIFTAEVRAHIYNDTTTNHMPSKTHEYNPNSK